MDFKNYAAFVTALKNAYDDSDARVTVERKLLNLKQGDRDCSAYHAEFATYVTILNYNDQTTISFFINGVNQGLLTALSYQAGPPDNVQMEAGTDSGVMRLKYRYKYRGGD